MNEIDRMEMEKNSLFVAGIIVVLMAVLPVVIIWSNAVYVFKP